MPFIIFIWIGDLILKILEEKLNGMIVRKMLGIKQKQKIHKIERLEYWKMSLASSLLFLLISNEGSELADFTVDFFVEVKAVFFAVSDLEQIVI